MKIFAFAFAILLAGVSAVPRIHLRPADLLAIKTDERFVDGIVADAIADISQAIRDAGLDPANINSLRQVVTLPVTDLLNLEANIEDFELTGLSNIVINRISWALLTFRLQFDISLPRIAATIGRAELDGEILGLTTQAGISGSFAIVEPRVVGDVRINIGIISGIGIRSLELDFSLGGIESNVNVNILGADYSETINQFFGNTLPGAIADNRAELNELIEYYAWIVLDGLL